MHMVAIDRDRYGGNDMSQLAVFPLEDGMPRPGNISSCINCLADMKKCPQQAMAVSKI